MWLRRLLVAALGVEERSAHTPAEVDWAALPQSVVLQLHWHRTAAFRRLLRRHGFLVVVLARHPLDTLVSIAHFAPHEPATARWLDGEHGDERLLMGAHPASAAFRSYALSPRARALLEISTEWWQDSLVAALVTYEDLVRHPADELRRIVDEVGGAASVEIERALEAASFRRLQAEATNQHFWRGHPGTWRKLLPSDLAQEIGAFHRGAFETFGYALDPDPRLTADAALDAWRRLATNHTAQPLPTPSTAPASTSSG